MIDETVRLLLVHNLYEEHGNLDSSQTHPELFRVFIRALDLEPGSLTQPSHNTTAASLIKHFEAICFHGSQHQVIAFLFTFESYFQSACELLLQGLHQSQILPTEALIFFDVHAEADIEHASQLKKALIHLGISPEEWDEVIALIHQAGRLLYEFFDSLGVATTQETLHLAV